MNWILYGAFAGICWATTDVIVRIFSDRINLMLAVVCISIGMLIASSVGFILMEKLGEQTVSKASGQVVISLIATGILNSMGYIFFLKFFHTGGNLTQGFPFISTVLALSAVAWGIFFFKDPVSGRIFLGVLCALAALYLLR